MPWLLCFAQPSPRAMGICRSPCDDQELTSIPWCAELAPWQHRPRGEGNGGVALGLQTPSSSPTSLPPSAGYRRKQRAQYRDLQLHRHKSWSYRSLPVFPSNKYPPFTPAVGRIILPCGSLPVLLPPCHVSNLLLSPLKNTTEPLPIPYAVVGRLNYILRASDERRRTSTGD